MDAVEEEFSIILELARTSREEITCALSELEPWSLVQIHFLSRILGKVTEIEQRATDCRERKA